MHRMLLGAGVAALLVGAAVGLSACDGGAASTAARDHAASTSAETTVASTGADRAALTDEDRADAGGDGRSDPRTQPVAMVDGTPMWAANRQHTAEENADYQFRRDGADFGARDEAAYVRLAHDFTGAPPKDVLTLTRPNGDKLLYDPKRNIFAVVTKDGAPRAMFKPQAGKAYWDQQVARQNDQSDQGDRPSSRRGYSRRSNGAGQDDQG
jgi:pyocin large subunit-like protein